MTTRSGRIVSCTGEGFEDRINAVLRCHVEARRLHGALQQERATASPVVPADQERHRELAEGGA